MLRKLALVCAVAAFVVASTLVPLETQAGDHGRNREGHRHHGGRHAGHVTVITQPTHQVHIRPHYWHHGHHYPGAAYVAPAQPVWVPAGWYWTGYQWTWVSGYWR